MRKTTTAQDVIEQVAMRLAGENQPHDAAYDREFAGFLAMLSGRIAWLIRQYRLVDLQDDAQQAAAIGVHRALATFDPTKARFTTHMTWQIRGELQGLRHRMRLDQRRSAVAAGISTVSLEELGVTDSEAGVFEVIDDDALRRVESAASDRMAWSVLSQALDQLGAPREERAIVRDYLFERSVTARKEIERTPEQCRQVVRRNMRNCAKVLAA